LEREKKRRAEELKLRLDAEERDKVREEKRMEREEAVVQRHREFLSIGHYQ
jgi:hypothetical protein